MVKEGQRYIPSKDIDQYPYAVVRDFTHEATYIVRSEHETLEDAQKAANEETIPVVIIKRVAIVLPKDHYK